MAVEVAQLAPGEVAQPVGVAPRREQHVLAPDVDAHAAVVAARVVRLGQAVALDVDELERDLAQPALGVAELQREVAVDAALDAVALGAHGDRLGHGEVAVRAHLDRRVVALDRLGTVRDAGGQGDCRRERAHHAETEARRTLDRTPDRACDRAPCRAAWRARGAPERRCVAQHARPVRRPSRGTRPAAPRGRRRRSRRRLA